MTTTISDILLARLSDFVAAAMGLHFPKERWGDLKRGALNAARDFHFNDPEQCVQWLLSSAITKHQIEILASHLTVGETFFFREQKSFETLEKHLLPALINSRRRTDQRLRIWSAGCCTGEEPYSIAISIARLIPVLTEWNITILATDINPHFLKKATQGEYKEWSFRNTPPKVKESYFISKDRHYTIIPHLKKLVTFGYLNLAEDVYPSLVNSTNGMDIIFCRNVLMYFTPEQAVRVIKNLYHSLVDGGWLLTSPSDASSGLYSRFATINFTGVTVYKKESNRIPVKEAIPFTPVREETAVPFIPPRDLKVQPLSDIQYAPPLPQEDSKPLPLKVETIAGRKPETTLYEKGLSLYQQGQYSEAIKKLLECLSHLQDVPKVYSLLVRAYADQGQIREALEWCEKAITADALNPGLYYLKATILQEQGAIEEAIGYLKRALYLDQDFVLAHFALGNLASQRGNLKASGKHFNNALSLLKTYEQEEILPESEGVTAGRLREIITGIAYQGSGIRVQLTPDH
jgi:chemotaxis protein methyltransferase CheR